MGFLIAGLLGTAVMTMVMKMAPKMGMPEMDVPGMLGSMFGTPNKMMGLVMHFMMGIVFAFIYSYFGLASWGAALLFGAVHWLVVGAMMGMMPMMHAGMKSGNVSEPGFWMTKNGGMMGFVGGLIGHLVFAVAVFASFNYLPF